MTLGENITRLRTARGLSQGALAEALEVSRQSVSKWETDASVPELDKLIKLAKLFEVTLDELVTGETPAAAHAPATGPEYIAFQKPDWSWRHFAGAVCLLLAIVACFSSNIYFRRLGFWPLLACGVICLLIEWHPCLCSMWAVVFMADIYWRDASAVSWRCVLLTLRWTAKMNYLRLMIAWGQFLGMLIIFLAAILFLRRDPPLSPSQIKRGIAVAFAAEALIIVVLITSFNGLHTWLSWRSACIEYPLMAAAAALILYILRKKRRKALSSPPETP